MCKECESLEVSAWRLKEKKKTLYNIASKVTQFEPINLLLSLACSIMFQTDADDSIISLKCMSVSLQWVWRNKNVTQLCQCLKSILQILVSVHPSSYAPYSKMAANKLFFCLPVN